MRIPIASARLFTFSRGLPVSITLEERDDAPEPEEVKALSEPSEYGLRGV